MLNLYLRTMADAREIYLTRHENSRYWVDFSDFNFFRLQPIDLLRRWLWRDGMGRGPYKRAIRHLAVKSAYRTLATGTAISGTTSPESRLFNNLAKTYIHRSE